MQAMNIHYDTATGQIMVYGNAPDVDGADSYLDGCKVLLVEQQDIDPQTQRVDLDTRTIVPRDTPAEPAPAMPLIIAAIRAELADTDHFMLFDYPIDDAGRDAWVSYRRALRELSRQPDARAMVEAWPARPDGADVAEYFRNRLSQQQGA
jgi:hypothetical protein